MPQSRRPAAVPAGDDEYVPPPAVQDPHLPRHHACRVPRGAGGQDVEPAEPPGAPPMPMLLCVCVSVSECVCLVMMPPGSCLQDPLRFRPPHFPRCACIASTTRQYITSSRSSRPPFYLMCACGRQPHHPQLTDTPARFSMAILPFVSLGEHAPVLERLP